VPVASSLTLVPSVSTEPSSLGGTTSVFESGWPSYDPALVVEDRVTMAVQVGGKTRGTISVAEAATQDDAVAAALADPNIAKFVTGTPKRIIFVPGRLINIIV